MVEAEAASDIVSMVASGGGAVVFGWLAHAAVRLMGKAEAVLDGTLKHRERMEAAAEKAGTHLAALDKALAH